MNNSSTENRIKMEEIPRQPAACLPVKLVDIKKLSGKQAGCHPLFQRGTGSNPFFPYEGKNTASDPGRKLCFALCR